MTDPAVEDSVWRWGLAEFRDRLASDAPTPGGGSAAMVAATIGLGLVVMALRVTSRRPEPPADIAALILSGERLMAELGRHADADIAVFEAYMEAVRLPRATEAEKAARRRALQDAAVAATEVPLNAAQTTLEAIDLAQRAAHVAHLQIVSDVGAGAAVLHGALNAVLYAVDINLRTITDEATRSDYRRSQAHLAETAGARAQAVARFVRDRLASNPS
jgi:methenyltetrahydrofolate cyclohydrolase